MRAVRFLLGIACLLAAGLPVRAAELARIERRVAKEPAYKGKPKYCLVVFGPEAAFRVWLVQDGDVLYVDRNGNGDLTDAEDRVPPIYHANGQFSFRPGKIGPDANTQYVLSQVRTDADACDMSVSLPKRQWARAGFDGPGPLRFAERAADAPIVHFFGPLTFQRFEPQPGCVSPHLEPLPLVRGRSNHLAFSVGTPGLGSGTFAKHDLEIGADALVELGNGKSFKIDLRPDG